MTIRRDIIEIEWASNADPRKTKIGKLFRKTRLDELPQLLNVLKGTMSFMGPPPIRKKILSRIPLNGQWANSLEERRVAMKRTYIKPEIVSESLEATAFAGTCTCRGHVEASLILTAVNNLYGT